MTFTNWFLLGQKWLNFGIFASEMQLVQIEHYGFTYSTVSTGVPISVAVKRRLLTHPCAS